MSGTSSAEAFALDDHVLLFFLTPKLSSDRLSTGTLVAITRSHGRLMPLATCQKQAGGALVEDELLQALHVRTKRGLLVATSQVSQD